MDILTTVALIFFFRHADTIGFRSTMITLCTSCCDKKDRILWWAILSPHDPLFSENVNRKRKISPDVPSNLNTSSSVSSIRRFYSSCSMMMMMVLHFCQWRRRLRLLRCWVSWPWCLLILLVRWVQKMRECEKDPRTANSDCWSWGIPIVRDSH